MRKIQIAQPSIGEEEWLALREPLEAGWLTQGPQVQQFEVAFSKHHSVKHAIAVTSATTGLHLALEALKLPAGGEVIVPAYTWISTANVVIFAGLKPAFVDIDHKTYNTNTQLILDRVTSETVAVMPVHLFGLCVDIADLRRQLPEHIHIIEDAACAAGGSLNGFYPGQLSDAAVFSFHPRKSITTGEGGMITTMNDELADRMNVLRAHGASMSEEVRHHGPRPFILPMFDELGFNYRMSDLQGAVGRVQLRKLDGFIKERAEWAKQYGRELSDVAWLRLPEEPAQVRHAWQAYVTCVDPETAPRSRNEIMEYLEGRGISTRPGTHAVHMLGYYRDHFGFRPDDFPNARACDENTMALPLHNKMTTDDISYIADTIRDIS